MIAADEDVFAGQCLAVPDVLEMSRSVVGRITTPKPLSQIPIAETPSTCEIAPAHSLHPRVNTSRARLKVGHALHR
jgi:hypothetical protein